MEIIDRKIQVQGTAGSSNRATGKSFYFIHKKKITPRFLEKVNYNLINQILFRINCSKNIKLLDVKCLVPSIRGINLIYKNKLNRFERQFVDSKAFQRTEKDSISMARPYLFKIKPVIAFRRKLLLKLNDFHNVAFPGCAVVERKLNFEI